ncbi:hypothetical protein GQ55_4G061500 [Panicum hallii var. hallii]|uniref:Uncharacterized protein n=1 Tax=Panicum hallii var. hallii TaxID=1504633 RepID=A0A2T7DVS1_9POAL|nr:hypothetical protein GQ55_4G061500 [Panicum hallii var. hallii]
MNRRNKRDAFRKTEVDKKIGITFAAQNEAEETLRRITYSGLHRSGAPRRGPAKQRGGTTRGRASTKEAWHRRRGGRRLQGLPRRPGASTSRRSRCKRTRRERRAGASQRGRWALLS